MLYIPQFSGKTISFWFPHAKKKKEKNKAFFPSANGEHLNRTALNFARGVLLAGGKEQCSVFT